ncbi:hypothetical protein [Actinacidiphila sp. bgisy144]|uniref:hypothetical protein n=1 Tax=Actinacidiphila sp. bgisy144 TaxID=3413791 RepID=UPI003EB8E187
MTYQNPWSPGAPQGQGGGCVAAAVRLPVSVFAFVVVLPLKLLWDALAWTCRTLWRYVLHPPLRALGLLLAALWRHVLVPVARVLIVVPAVWLWTYVLRPVLRALGLTAEFLVRWLLVRPLTALWVYALQWVVRGLAWLLKYLVVVPLDFLWRRVLAPLLREVAAAVAAAWRAAAYVARQVGRGIGWFFRVLVFRPIAFVWRWTAAPVLRFVRRQILHPVRVALADARRAVGAALFGTPRQAPPPRPSREARHQARLPPARSYRGPAERAEPLPPVPWRSAPEAAPPAQHPGPHPNPPPSGGGFGPPPDMTK